MVKTAPSPPRKNSAEFFEMLFYHSNSKISEKKSLAKFDTISM